jgi:hypothetical protein
LDAFPRVLRWPLSTKSAAGATGSSVSEFSVSNASTGVKTLCPARGHQMGDFVLVEHPLSNAPSDELQKGHAEIQQHAASKLPGLQAEILNVAKVLLPTISSPTWPYPLCSLACMMPVTSFALNQSTRNNSSNIISSWRKVSFLTIHQRTRETSPATLTTAKSSLTSSTTSPIPSSIADMGPLGAPPPTNNDIFW